MTTPDPDYLLLRDETGRLCTFAMLDLTVQFQKRGYTLKRQDEEETPYSQGV